MSRLLAFPLSRPLHLTKLSPTTSYPYTPPNATITFSCKIFMPCRAFSICRQATAPSQCLWITDDVLAEAWSRFTRVSNAASKRRCEGRRYGSNVPGPLEAHRRLSKRRMGVAAVAGGRPPMGADFGALFGIGTFKPEQKVDGWKWEAPQLDRRKEKEVKTDTGWFAPAKTQRQDAWDSFLQPPALEEDAPDAKTAIQNEEQAIEQSESAFHTLLSDISHLDHIDKDHLVQVLDFLQSAADEPKAGNFTSLSLWLKERHLSDAAYSAIAKLIKEKVELGTCGDDLATVLAALLQHTKPTSCSNIADILDGLEPEELPGVSTNVTRELFVTASATSHAEAEAALPTVEIWLECLLLCQRLQGWHCDSPTWQNIYAVLAQHIDTPSVLAQHFLTLRRADLSRVLLRYWAGAANADRPSSLSQDGTTMSFVGLEKRLNFRQPLDDVDMNAVLRDFDAMRAARYKRQEERLQTSSSLVDMLDVARRHGLRHDWVCEEVFDILMQSSAVNSVQKVSWEIRRHRDLGLTLRTAHRLVHYFLRHGKLNFAHSLFRAVPALSPLHFPKLLINLARQATIGSSRMWELLQRQVDSDYVEYQDRDPRTPELSFVPEHVDLIHLVAHSFANSPALTSRMAYRRVWHCYLFLRDRRAPVNSLLTRALVQAGVTRRLKVLKRPSTEQFRYILDLVARIEGQETAEKLDRAVYKYWTERVRPNLSQLNRTVDAALGMSEDVARQKRRAAWYSLRRWSREHRPWLLSPRKKSRAALGKRNAATTISKSLSSPQLPGVCSGERSGPEIVGPTSLEMGASTETEASALSTDYVPCPVFAAAPPEPSLPVPSTPASRVAEVKVIDPEPLPVAPRHGLGYSAPHTTQSTAEPSIRFVAAQPGDTTAVVMRSTTRALTSAPLEADTSYTKTMTFMDAPQTTKSILSSNKVVDETDVYWLDAQDVEQPSGKGVIALSEAKSSGLMQKRLPLYFRKHDVSSKPLPLAKATPVEVPAAEDTYLHESPGWNPSATPPKPISDLPNAASKTLSTEQDIGKLNPLSFAETQSLDRRGICLRCRQPGHRTGDANCPANTWKPSLARPPTQPNYEYLEWRKGTNGQYTLLIENDGEWRPYTQVQGRVRQIRRKAKDTGRAYREKEYKLFEKWEVAQEEMAKRTKALHRVPRSTLFPR